MLINMFSLSFYISKKLINLKLTGKHLDSQLKWDSPMKVGLTILYLLSGWSQKKVDFWSMFPHYFQTLQRVTFLCLCSIQNLSLWPIKFSHMSTLWLLSAGKLNLPLAWKSNCMLIILIHCFLVNDNIFVHRKNQVAIHKNTCIFA